MMRFPLTDYPGMNPFVLNWVTGDARATAFLPRRHGGAIEAAAAGEKSSRRVDEPLLAALASSNRKWGSFIEDELRRWAAGDTVTLMAGQQTGFAGGPFYTLAKICSLIKMKRQLAARGVEATIFFWLATEDHDYAEAATLHVPVALLPQAKEGVNRQLDLLTLRATRAVESKRVVGRSPIPEALAGQLLSLFDMDRPAWLREGIEFGDSFAELCATVFAEKIIYVDALLPELRRAGAPLFERLLSETARLQSLVEERSAALHAAGYVPQIVARPGEPYTLLFRLDESGERHIIHGDESTGDPATISTTALTRPLLQDFVFAPEVFVGGPAEVAYYAQIAPLHEALGVPMPAIALRGHALVAPRRVARLIERFAIGAGELFSTADAIAASRESEAVEEIETTAAAARADLTRALTAIGELALPADHSVARALTRSIGHIEYHFEKMTQRAIRALARKDRERHAALRELIATLYPDRHVQDRVVAWFAWWCAYGSDLPERVIEQIEPDSDSFGVIPL